MEYFIKYLERKIEACDELGGLQREKAVYQSTLKEYRKAIKVIPCCKSDSEQLFALLNWIDYGDEEDKKYVVETFLKDRN
jgi:hypothetical protein